MRLISQKHGDTAPWLQQHIWATRPLDATSYFLTFLIFDWLTASRARDSFREHSMAIRILATGGTFDKEYNERTGQLYFKDTHIAEMLRLGRSQVEVSIRTVMMTDSLEMTDADRNLIVQNCLQSAEDRIVITHGTDI